MLSKQEVLKQYSYYFERDFPIPYIPFKYRKDESRYISLVPVKMKDFNRFFYFIQSLTYDESELVTLRKTYLDYLLYLHEKDKNGEFNEKVNGYYNEKKDVLFKFLNVLSLCLNIPIHNIDISKDKNDRTIIVLNKKVGFKKVDSPVNAIQVVRNRPLRNEITLDEINKHINSDRWYGDVEFKYGDFVQLVNNSDTNEYIELTYKDIDNIRQLINYQNIYNYDDSYLDPMLKQDMEATAKLKNKDGNIDSEKRRIDISYHFGIDYYGLEELTIRRYYAFASFIQNVTAWELMKQAECSGFVEIKNPIKHYLTEDDDTFSNLVKADEIKDKLK